MSTSNVEMRDINNNTYYPVTDANIVKFGSSNVGTILTDRIVKTTGNITYYVSTTGNDLNNGLSSGTPFKTITKAISMIPQVVNHIVAINVSSGSYNEIINLSGFIISGAIVINGGSNNTNASSYIVNQILITACTGIVNITGFTTITTSDSSIIVVGSSMVSIIACVSTVSAPSYSGLTVKNGSFCYCVNSIFSYKNFGIWCACASLMSESNGGSSNNYGIYAQNCGTIGKYGTQTTGSTPEGIIAGGQIR